MYWYRHWADKCGLSVIYQHLRCLCVWLRNPHCAQHVGSCLNWSSFHRWNAVNVTEFSSYICIQECKPIWIHIQHLTLPALIIATVWVQSLVRAARSGTPWMKCPKWESYSLGPERCLGRNVLVLLILFSSSHAVHQHSEMSQHLISEDFEQIGMRKYRHEAAS